jgi:hypothetical protein
MMQEHSVIVICNAGPKLSSYLVVYSVDIELLFSYIQLIPKRVPIKQIKSPKGWEDTACERLILVHKDVAFTGNREYGLGIVEVSGQRLTFQNITESEKVSGSFAVTK